MRSERITFPLIALARRIGHEEPRRFVMLKFEICPSSSDSHQSSISGNGVSWTGSGSSREVSLFVAILGNSLPESSPYYGGDFELELRLKAIEGEALVVRAVRFCGEIYHPNFFPNVGISSYPQQFIPAFYNGSHRIFQVLDGIYERLDNPLLPSEENGLTGEAHRSRCLFRSDIIDLYLNHRMAFENRARSVCLNEGRRKVSLRRHIAERSLEKVLLKGGERLQALEKEILKGFKQFDRRKRNELVQGGGGPKKSESGLLNTGFPTVSDVSPIPIVDNVVASKTAGIRSSDLLYSSLEQEMGYKRDDSRPIVWLQIVKLPRDGGAAVVLEGVQPGAEKLQTWRWSKQDCNSYCVLVLSRKDLSVKESGRYSPTHPSGLEKLIHLFDKYTDDSLVTLYTESWGARERLAFQWMRKTGLDHEKVFEKCGCNEWMPHKVNGVYSLVCIPSLGQDKVHASEQRNLDGQTLEVALVMDRVEDQYQLIVKEKIYRLQLGDVLVGTDGFEQEIQELLMQAYLCMHRPTLLDIFAYYAMFGGAAGNNNPYRMGSRQWLSFIIDCKLPMSFVDGEHVYKEATNYSSESNSLLRERLYLKNSDACCEDSDLLGGTTGQILSDGEMGFDAFMEGISRIAIRIYKSDLDVGFAVRSLLYDKVLPTAQRLQANEEFDSAYTSPECQDILNERRRDLSRIFMLATPNRWTHHISPGRWVEFLKITGMIGNSLTLARALSFFVLANGGPEAPRRMKFASFCNGFARCAAESHLKHLDLITGESLGRAMDLAMQQVVSKERELMY